MVSICQRFVSCFQTEIGLHRHSLEETSILASVMLLIATGAQLEHTCVELQEEKQRVITQKSTISKLRLRLAGAEAIIKKLKNNGKEQDGMACSELGSHPGGNWLPTRVIPNNAGLLGKQQSLLDG
jgi:hypothetical protein